MGVSSRFIIIEHKAKVVGLHFDLRFKKPNSNLWASFAVRKGVPVELGKKVLAIRTKDHSEKEALITGKIKQGYGAGVLKKWDDGQCIIHKFGYSHIVIDLKGRKVKGIYHLVSLKVIKKPNKTIREYFLFKGKIVQEIDNAGTSCGMVSRIPPGDTQEVEIGDEDADKQTEPLPWTFYLHS